jgi:hypothetical protein
VSEEFACPNCDCPSVVYPDTGEDDGHVTCRACGTFFATLAQFRSSVERRAPRSDTETSGCWTGLPPAASLLRRNMSFI